MDGLGVPLEEWSEERLQREHAALLRRRRGRVAAAPVAARQCAATVPLIVDVWLAPDGTSGGHAYSIGHLEREIARRRRVPDTGSA